MWPNNPCNQDLKREKIGINNRRDDRMPSVGNKVMISFGHKSIWAPLLTALTFLVSKKINMNIYPRQGRPPRPSAFHFFLPSPLLYTAVVCLSSYPLNRFKKKSHIKTEKENWRRNPRLAQSKQVNTRRLHFDDTYFSVFSSSSDLL
jgi:hypothetical protein